jgi:hypothetical protein
MERIASAPEPAHDDVAVDLIDGLCRIADLRRFLHGCWRLARVIDDRRAGQTGVLRGEARFDADGAGLVLTETGRLRLGAHAGPACRRTLYRFPAPARAEVLFADGQPFHMLDLSEGACTAIHRCDADFYRGAFRAPDPDTLLVRWTVTGPRKDAVLTSRYRRRRPAAG